MAKKRRVPLEAFLEAIRSKLEPVATPAEFSRQFFRERGSLKLPQRLSAVAALQQLVDEGSLQEFLLASEKYGRMDRIGLLPEVDVFDIALSLKGRAYFCHGTAVFLHGLTDDVPTTFYVNREQSPKKPPSGELTQVGIDRAFAAKGRRSAYTFKIFRAARVKAASLENVDIFWTRESVGAALGEVTLLSGKHTDDLEVGTALTPRGRAVPTTKLERTLIDIAVRPDYAGGTARVAEAYERAVARGISSGVLLATLKALDYKYPYHQAIGFYLERAGAGPHILDKLRAMNSGLKFYLNYSIKKATLNGSWNVYVPEGM